MEVILLQKSNLGNIGDIVNVKPGYSRNYLIPQKVAVVASDENKAYFEQKKAELEKMAAEKVAMAEARAAELDKLHLTIEALASDEGKLYGSVGINEIKQAIEAAGVTISKQEIKLPAGPIYHVGDYEILIQLYIDITAKVKLTVGTK